MITSLSFEILTCNIKSNVLKELSLNTCSELYELASDLKKGVLGHWLWKKNCQLLALSACQKKLISAQEFCSLAALVQLIQDHKDLNLCYGKLSSLKAHSLRDDLPGYDLAIELIRNSLKMKEDMHIINEKKFKNILKKISILSNFEKTFFTLELNNEEKWPEMLKALAENNKVFHLIETHNKKKIILPSFSIRRIFLEKIFGKKNFCVPIPVLGHVDIKKFLRFSKNGGRVVSYNFPNLELPIYADMIFSGRYFYSEHDWSHMEEGSIVEKSLRKFFVELNTLYLNPYFNLKNDGTSEYRIFTFADMEFQIYNAIYKNILKLFPHNIKIFEICKNIYVKSAIVLMVFFEVLGLPMGYLFTTLEIKYLEKMLFGVNSSTFGEIKVVPKNILNSFQEKWNADVDTFSKKLIMHFVMNADKLIKKYGFNPEYLDWEIELEETKKVINICMETVSGFKKHSFEEIKEIFCKFKQYFLACKESLEKIKKDFLEKNPLNDIKDERIKQISTTWEDPMPNFSFKIHDIAHLEFHIGKGIKIKKILKA